MKISENFLEDEVREGFYVSGMMKKVWAGKLTTLDFIDRFCRAHHIRWFLCAGSMLGAVRHHGFIPWDDDVDICMLREDFNRFVEAMRKEKPKPYFIEEQRFDEYNELLPVVSNSRRMVNFNRKFLENNYQSPYAASIDLFVRDYYADDEIDELWRDTSVQAIINVRLMLEKLLKNRSSVSETEKDEVFVNYDGTKAARLSLDEIRKLAPDNKEAALILENLKNIDFLTKHPIDSSKPLLHQLNILYTGLISYFKSSEGSLVRSYPNWLTAGDKGVPKEWYAGEVRMPFENLLLPVPSGYDQILRHDYGDYSRKVIGCGDHEYPFFSKLEKEIIELNHPDRDPYQLHFSSSDLPDPVKREQNPKISADRILHALDKLSGLLAPAAAEGNAEDVLYLLGNLQEGYVNLGNLIEESRGADHPVIRKIEKLCDLLYESYQGVAANGMNDDAVATMLDACQVTNEAIRRDYLDKREILFLLDRVKNWPALRSIAEAASKDSGCHVSVMLIPWHRKNGDGSIAEEAEIDSREDILPLPPEAQSISDKEYDIQRVHPDMIFTVNGYDYYNYVRTIDIRNFTQFLWRMTDCLVYLPWFTLQEFDKGDPQWVTVPFFARIPGVLYADRTVVQSERIQRLYVDAMEEGDPTIPESFWMAKIKPWGSALWDCREYNGVGPNADEKEAVNAEKHEQQKQYDAHEAAVLGGHRHSDDGYGSYIWKMLQEDIQQRMAL